MDLLIDSDPVDSAVGLLINSWPSDSGHANSMPADIRPADKYWAC